MNGNIISKSPRNIRRIDFSIAEGILRALRNHANGVDEALVVSEGLQKAVEIDEKIESRTTKCEETLMELRRLELIERKRIGSTTIYSLLPNGRDALSTIDKEGREKYFFELIYSKEHLFRTYIDMLQRRGVVDDDDALQISGINRVKISFIKAILRQVPSVAKMCRNGRKSLIKYVGIEPISLSEIRKSIISEYTLLIGDKLFVKIDDLWKSLSSKYPDLSEKLFDKIILDLANNYVGKVELLQGVSPPQAKLLFDKRSGTYFHYLKIPEDLLNIVGNG